MYPISKVKKPLLPIEWFLLVMLSILWGSSFFFNSIALSELPTLTIVTIRLLIGSVSLLVACRFLGLSIPRNKNCIKAFIIMGLLCNVFPFLLIVWGQNHISSALASILNSSSPFFTLILVHYLTDDEKITKLKLLALLLGIFGVAVMLFSDTVLLFSDGTLEFTRILAQLSILCAALFYGFANVYGRIFKQMNVTPLAAATGQVTASSLLLLPFSLYFEPPWELLLPSASVIFSLLSLGCLSSALAFIIFYRILNSAGAVNLSLVSFLIPIVSILLGIFILDEKLFMQHLFGFSLIAISLVLMDGRTKVILRRLFS